MLYECGHSLAHLRAHGSSLIGPKLWSAIHEGLAIKAAHYDEARRAIAQMRQKFFGRFKPHQVFLMPATPQTAPKGLDWTGDPSYIAGWTALGGPILTVPLCKDLEKLPIAALLINVISLVWSKKWAGKINSHICSSFMLDASMPFGIGLSN